MPAVRAMCGLIRRQTSCARELYPPAAFPARVYRSIVQTVPRHQRSCFKFALPGCEGCRSQSVRLSRGVVIAQQGVGWCREYVCIPLQTWHTPDGSVCVLEYSVTLPTEFPYSGVSEYFRSRTTHPLAHPLTHSATFKPWVGRPIHPDQNCCASSSSQRRNMRCLGLIPRCKTPEILQG